MGGMLIYKQFARGEQFSVMRVEGEQIHTCNGQETAISVVYGTCQGLSGHDFACRVMDDQYYVCFLWQGYTQYVFAMRRIGRKADSAVSVVGIVFVVAFVVLLYLVAEGRLIVCRQERE